MQLKYNTQDVEAGMLKFWEDNQIYQKVKAKGKGKTKFYFLQGPPYTSGRIHIGHAWNNSLKDITLRYKRMAGFDVWDRAGYDMHGLPTENKVQAQFKLKAKEDIIAFGMDKFIKECIKFSSENAKLMDQDLWKLGVWMDYENAYWPLRNKFIEGEWWLIKKAYEGNRLYKGEQTMHWCAQCETNLAKHELEYQNVKDKSIFLKFQTEDNPKEYFIIWTTTPWTIPFNMAIMVNPELDYVKAKVDDEVWIIAKALVNAFLGIVGKPYEIIEEFKGTALENRKYQHPFENDIPFFKEHHDNPKLHTVVMSSQFVDVSAGSGLVHCAPGCGPEDYQVGRENGLPPFNNLNEQGIFEDMGLFNGWVAKKDDNEFIKELEKHGALIETTVVEHDYPHCWRCHKPVIFRKTTQWFLKVEDLREKFLAANEDIEWVPKRGRDAFKAWMSSLRDNSITRQRFWGTPVPIWECECGKEAVIGSAAELKEKATSDLPEDLHKPWIDDVKIKCDCGKEMSRVPDVIDVWLDSSTVSWNCLDYGDPKLINEWFPADFILEATEQIRLWFSMLLIGSFITMDKPAFKSAYMHGMILDWQGMKMSKSMGNVISPYEVIEKVGSDVLRYYMCGTPAGENINFVWDETKIKQRNLIVLWNVHKYLIDLAKNNNVNPASLDPTVMETQLDIEEKYILSKLNSAIEKQTALFDAYHLDRTPWNAEEFYLELSRTYIKLIRDKAAIGSKEEKEVVLYTIYQSLLDFLKMFAPIAPFVTEQVYQNLKEAFSLETESIHLMDWPKANRKLINEELEQQMIHAKAIIESILYGREQAKMSVRWPLSRIDVVTESQDIQKAVDVLEPIIKTQTNVKAVKAHSSFDDTANKVEVEFKGGKLYLTTTMTDELEAEGYSREIMRRVQASRRTAKLEKGQSINLHVKVSEALASKVKGWEDKIAEKVGARAIVISAEPPVKRHHHEAEAEIKGETVVISFDTVEKE